MINRPNSKVNELMIQEALKAKLTMEHRRNSPTISEVPKLVQGDYLTMENK